MEWRGLAPRQAALTPVLSVAKEPTAVVTEAPTPTETLTSTEANADIVTRVNPTPNAIDVFASAIATTDITTSAALTTTQAGGLVIVTTKPVTTAQIITVSVTPTQSDSTERYILVNGVETPVLPLTKTFTPDNACFTNVYDIAGISGRLTVYPTDLTECYPYSTEAVYSPGVCPDGYHVGNWPKTGELTTIINCCPGVLQYTTGSCVTVLSTLNQPPIETSLSGFGAVTGSLTATTYHTLVDIDSSSTETITTAFSTYDRITITAPVFTVMFQSSDELVSKLWDSSISVAREEDASRSKVYADYLSSKGLSPSSSPSSSPSPSSLSSGAIAGIVIGAVAALLIVIGGAFLWLKKRRRSRTPQPEYPVDKKEGQQGGAAWAKSELDNTQPKPHELYGHPETRQAELPPAELPGHDHQHSMSQRPSYGPR